MNALSLSLPAQMCPRRAPPPLAPAGGRQALQLLRSEEATDGSATPDRRGAGEVNGVFCHCQSHPYPRTWCAGASATPVHPGARRRPDALVVGPTPPYAELRGRCGLVVANTQGVPRVGQFTSLTSRAPRRPDPGTVRLASASLPHRPERETKDQINGRPRHGPRRDGGPAARRRQEDARAEMERACN